MRPQPHPLLRFPLLAALLGASACMEPAGDGPYALADDDTAAPPDDDTTAPPDDDTTAPPDDDTTPPDDDTTPDEPLPTLYPDPDGSLYGPVSLAIDLVPLFTDPTTGCYCHLTELGPVPGLLLDTADDAFVSLVDVPSKLFPGSVRVVPAAPEQSLLFAKLYQEYEVFPFEGSYMPPAGARLGEAELNLVYNWILQGALNN